MSHSEYNKQNFFFYYYYLIIHRSVVVDKPGLLSVGYRIERIRLTNTGLYKTVLIILYVNLTFAGVSGSGKHQILFL